MRQDSHSSPQRPRIRAWVKQQEQKEIEVVTEPSSSQPVKYQGLSSGSGIELERSGKDLPASSVLPQIRASDQGPEERSRRVQEKQPLPTGTPREIQLSGSQLNVPPPKAPEYQSRYATNSLLFKVCFQQVTESGSSCLD